MLPLLLLRINVKQHQDLQLPPYAGSMLRGAFGHALKHVTCTTKLPNCQQCPLAQLCVYTQVFEAAINLQSQAQPQFVNPYVIKAPCSNNPYIAANSMWYFDMVLVGKAIEQWPIVAFAWQKACQDGFGKGKSAAELISIYQNDHVLYQPQTPLNHYQLTAIKPLNNSNQVTLNFVTPLRLQHQNHVILHSEQLSAPILLMGLAKRIQRLTELHATPVSLQMPTLLAAAQHITLQTQLKRDTLARYSNRQQRSMNLDGLIGSITLTGDLTLFALLLSLGELIHLGKNATMGMGQYLINRD